MNILKYHLQIQTQAINHDLPASLIAAICMTESAGNPWSVRFEREWQWFLDVEMYARRSGASVETERHSQMFSWGLMHVMGSVGRQHAAEEIAAGEVPMLSESDFLVRLCDVDVSLHYGCRHFRKFLKKYHGSEMDAIAAYNRGWPQKKPSGEYVNQKYVDTVLGFKRELLELD